MVIEVTSPDTRVNDVGIKVDYYFRGRVAWYLIADVTIEDDGERRIELILYRRTGRAIGACRRTTRGGCWLEPVGLWLGQTRDEQGGFMRLACYDPATGEEVGDYTAISRTLAESQERLGRRVRSRERAERRARSEAKARAKAEQAPREGRAGPRNRGPRARGGRGAGGRGASPRTGRASARKPRPRSAPSKPSSSGRDGPGRESGEVRVGTADDRVMVGPRL